MRELITAAFKTGTGSLITLALSALSIKIIALVVGTDGVGLFSLLKQTHQTAVIVGSLGGQTALVQGLASLKGIDQSKYLSWGFLFFLFGSIVSTSCFLLFPSQLGHWIFGKSNTVSFSLVRWLSLPIFLGIILVFLSSVLNGFRAIGRLAVVQIAAAFGVSIFAYPFASIAKNNHPGSYVALLSISLSSGILASLIASKNTGWLHKIGTDLDLRYFRKAFKQFFSLGGTTLITGFMGTGALLFLRIMIVRNLNLQGAGFFDVSWTLSMTYVMLVLSSFGTYYLPKLSSITSAEDRTILIKSLMKISILLMVPLVTSVIVLKPIFVSILYSPEFLPALKMIRWMLIGDYLKVASWVLAMPMIAYADMKTFFMVEFLWNLGFIFISTLTIVKFADLQFVGFTFFALYFLNFIYSLYYVNRKGYLSFEIGFIIPILIGFAIIIGASFQTWNHTSTTWIFSCFWIICAISFSWLSLSKEERQKLLNLIFQNLHKLFNFSP